jgi:hypothetical protein
MLGQQQNHATANAPLPADKIAHTTIYNVIEAVAGVIGPGEEKLIATVVTQLLGDCRARFACDFRNGPAETKGVNHTFHVSRRAEA